MEQAGYCCARWPTGRWRRTQRHPSSTQLPEITVTAPSPIVRRRAVVPSRTPVRVARTAPGHNRERAPEAASRTGRGRASAGRAAHRHRSICDRHGGAERGDPPPRHRPAWRSPVLEARHYRLDLRARCLEPADHPGPRRQSRRHPRERHQRWRCVRSRRRPFRASRSTGDKPGRSYPRSGGDALRIDIDRRRRQRNQQSHPGCLANMRGRTVPDLRTAGESAARKRGITFLRHGRNPNGRQFRRPRCRWRHPDRCRRWQFCCSCRRLWPQGQRLQHSELSVFVRPDPPGQRPATQFGDAGGWCIDWRLLHLRWRIYRRGDHAERHALSDSRHRRRRSPDPHRRASDQIHGQGRIQAGRGGDRRGTFLGRRHRLQAQRDRTGRPRRLLVPRRAADLYQQGAGRPRGGADGAVQRALCRRHDRVRPAGRASGTDGAESG